MGVNNNKIGPFQPSYLCYFNDAFVYSVIHPELGTQPTDGPSR